MWKPSSLVSGTDLPEHQPPRPRASPAALEHVPRTRPSFHNRTAQVRPRQSPHLTVRNCSRPPRTTQDLSCRELTFQLDQRPETHGTIWGRLGVLEEAGVTVGHSGIEYLGACVALPVGTDCHLPLPQALSPQIPAGGPQVWGEGGLIPCVQCLGLLIHLSGAGLDCVADKSQELLAWGLALTLPHIPQPPYHLAPGPGPGLGRWAAVEPSAEVT